ncbi:Serine carboxypeptidase S28 [Popillia japonica]|uniref:Serine carboxypeptidase S28 n=1 Tax=Popillia japonica TaxID=7064 RepID=A0AAW1IUX5_POPJA
MGWLILILCFTNVILISEGTISFRSRHGPLRHISPTKGAKHPKSHTITQKLDHFNPSDNRTWSMRYFSNDQFFKRSGPIFVFIGGEWEINSTELMGGHLFEIASQHGGMMFYTEHRYYGQSIPFKNLTVGNLKYLSADQALIDLVYFIQKMKSEIFIC